MFNIKDNFTYKNGTKNGFGYKSKKNEELDGSFLSDIGRKIQVNEWTFSLFLFVMSLTIVAVKVLVMYGSLLPTKTYDLVKTPRLITELNTAFYNDNNLLNATREYKETLIDTVVEFINKFGWFMKAALSGLSLMAFTWFIVYKDSRIPGVNPPSPFSPTKRKYSNEPRIQMNYLIGVINGILIFIYMCL